MLSELSQCAPPPKLAYFTFTIDYSPYTKLDFDAVQPNPKATGLVKRLRPRADVDGEGSEHVQKKKRRLRRELITSRLSRPFATPTTYIASRGTSRVAKRGRQRTAGQNLLRKAALINWTRIQNRNQAKNDQTRLREQLLEDCRRYNENQEMTDEDDNRPPTPFSDPSPPRGPPSPSPLGISNYDAIDLEGDPYDDEGCRWEDAGDELVYSDFNRRLAADTILDDYDAFPSSEYPIASTRVSMPSSKDLISLVTEEEKQNEISFAQFGPGVDRGDIGIASVVILHPAKGA